MHVIYSLIFNLTTKSSGLYLYGSLKQYTLFHSHLGVIIQGESRGALFPCSTGVSCHFLSVFSERVETQRKRAEHCACIKTAADSPLSNALSEALCWLATLKNCNPPCRIWMQQRKGCSGTNFLLRRIIWFNALLIFGWFIYKNEEKKTNYYKSGARREIPFFRCWGTRCKSELSLSAVGAWAAGVFILARVGAL